MTLKNQISKEETIKLIAQITEELNNLPSSEFSYYIAMLAGAIKNEAQPEKHQSLLEKSLPLMAEIKKLYLHPENAAEQSIQVTKALNDLIEISSMQTLPHKIKQILLKVCGVVVGLLLGIGFALAGAVTGLFSHYNVIGNFKAAGLGFLSGFIFGAVVGYRSPSRLLQSTIDTKIEFCIENLVRLGGEFTERKPHKEYQDATKKYILDTFFKDTPENEREAAFEQFLEDGQSYEVVTTTAGHFSSSLKGHLGHHSFIRYKINGIVDTPIEFGARKKTPIFVDQSQEPTVVSGQVLFDMLVFDRILQDTHLYNTDALRIYDLANDDCLTYVDKVLVCTRQQPTKVVRFTENDTAIARKLIAPAIGFFKKTNEGDLQSLLAKPDEKGAEVTLHRFNKRNVPNSW